MHFSTRHTTLRLYALSALFACLASAVLAKGGGVGYWLEGKVSGVRVVDDRVELVIAGRLTFDQYTGGRSTRQAVHYECERGISASLVQWESFFAMSADWRAGGLRGSGELARLAQAALKRGNVALDLGVLELAAHLDRNVGGCPTTFLRPAF